MAGGYSRFERDITLSPLNKSYVIICAVWESTCYFGARVLIMEITQLCWTPIAGWEKLPGSASAADLVIAFSEASYFRMPACYEDLRRMFPDAHIVGCSSSGNIRDTHITDTDVVVTAITFDTSHVKLVRADVVPGADLEALAAGMMNELKADDLRHAFVLSDGLSVNGSDLARGLNSIGISVTGGLAGDGARFTSTWVMADAPAAQNVVAIIGFYGDQLTAQCGCVAGWREFGAERLVTRSSGNVVFEIDYKPALTVYTKYLGDQAKDLPSSGLRFPLSIRSSEQDEPVIRTLLAVDVEAQSLTFAGDVPQGGFCRLMKTDIDSLIDGSGMAASAAKFDASETTSLCLIVSCVGRRLVMGQLTEEELDIVRERLGPLPAITGFYSYGELAPFADAVGCRLHNQTMTLTTLQEQMP